MAKARQIVKRRKSVTNIRKITRTMQLIATAKFQKCLNRASASKPYTEKIVELVQQLSGRVENLTHPLLEVNRGANREALLVLTSNRGLCGGYNASILRTAVAHLQESGEVQTELDVSGKKGAAYFRFLGRQLRRSYFHFDERVNFQEVEQLADEFIRRYSAGELDAVYVAYMKFLSVARQKPTVTRLLPMSREAAAGAEPVQPQRSAPQYDFSPPPAELLQHLLPQTVKVQLFQCFMDAAVSEQIARMVAMKAATDAASDMIKILTRTYNRARQTQITLELLDIVGGAEALK